MSEFFSRLRRRFSKLLEQDIVIILISILSAIVIWFVISITVYPEIKIVLYNVPVRVDLTGTIAEANNIQVAGLSATTVSVEIKGDRGDVGSIKAEDLTAVLSGESVLSAKEYQINVNNIVDSKGRTFIVEAVDPPMISVDFNKIVTRPVPVKVRTDSIHLAEGFIYDSDNINVAPGVVNITGPEDIVGNITDLYVELPDDIPTAESFEVVSDKFDLYNNNRIIQGISDKLQFDRTSFSVSVPVYRKQTVSLDIIFSNAPDSFDTAAFKEKLKFSLDKLDIQVLDGTEQITSVVIGTIDMRQADLGKVFEFYPDVFLPAGYENLSAVDKITVACPTEEDGFAYRVITIRGSAVQVVNKPPDLNFEIITSGLTVTFIGNSNDDITAADVTAVIDINSAPVSSAGSYKLPVDFSVPEHPDIWWVGTDGVLSHKATVIVTE
jgi:YbbR domain-containing protein